jgi:hypothetical protein
MHPQELNVFDEWLLIIDDAKALGPKHVEALHVQRTRQLKLRRAGLL